MPAHRIVATEDLCPSVFYAWMLVQAGKQKKPLCCAGAFVRHSLGLLDPASNLGLSGVSFVSDARWHICAPEQAKIRTKAPVISTHPAVAPRTLILLDGMVCALVAYSLWRLCGKCAFWLWLLLPTPLAPALSTFLGILYL